MLARGGTGDAMNAICVVIDRLHAGYVSCYGNTWISTPEFSRLAAESLVLDAALVDSPRLPDLVTSYWSGHHARHHARATVEQCLPRLLRDGGIHAELISDEIQVVEHPWAAEFAHKTYVEQGSLATEGTEPALSQLASGLACATQWLDQPREPFCLWLHLRGMAGPWDAPFEYRQQYADPEDPPAPDLREPPHLLLSDDHDPDLVFGICQAYAGQVSLLDELLGSFLDAVREGPLARRTLVMVLGARGLALGEHRRIGFWDQELAGELVRFPCWLRFPDGRGGLDRCNELVQPPDLFQALASWFELGSAAPQASGIDLLGQATCAGTCTREQVEIVGSPTEHALRTQAWYLRQSSGETPGEPTQTTRLFAKPDDRWEVNDVADRCPEAAEALTRALDALAGGESQDRPA